MLQVLAVCHTVVIEQRKGKDYYNASSPDELALVNCAKYYGWEFKGRDESNRIEIQVGDKKEYYELLHVMEFTSGRKRMSCIVKNPKGQIMVMCKGADSIILERLADNENNKEIVEVTNRYLEGYAKDGLRTLLLGQKELSSAEYEAFSAKMKEASQSMTDRDDKIEEVASEMERGFTLIGSTAIEDKLQDDVDGTIKFMREAGIRVWVLTGDKIETAINIGFSCKLLTNDMQQYLIDGSNEQAVLEQISEHRKNQINTEGITDSATIVAGDSLFKIMANERIKENFLRLSTKSKVLIACRMSPK